MQVPNKMSVFVLLLCFVATLIACADGDDETAAEPNENEQDDVTEKEGPDEDYDGPYLDADDAFEIWRSPVRGNPDALVTVVAFEEFNCPHCRDAQPVIDEMLEVFDGDVRFVFKHFPLDHFTHAYSSAQAARAAYAQDVFWEFHDALFNRQDEIDEDLYLELAEDLELDLEAFDDLRDSAQAHNEVKADRELGGEWGVGGTPTFFVNGKKFPGNATFEDDFKPHIESERAAMQELIDDGKSPEDALKTRIDIHRVQN